MKNRKWIFCGAGAAVLAAIAVAGRRKLRKRKTDPIDGGVVTHSTGDDQPKVIKSTQIDRFCYKVSLLSEPDPGELRNRVYTFQAERKNEKAACKLAWYGCDSGKFVFETDTQFFDALQEIVVKYDLAQYNGRCHCVSGLPDLYGEILSVEYESGESIYAKNNQSVFMPMAVASDLRSLFGEASGACASDCAN